MFKTFTRALPVFLAVGAFAADPTYPSNVDANAKVPGIVAPNILSPELAETLLATGSMKLENPSGVIKYYGYNDDGTFIPTTPGSAVEAHKTEPDKNTYLVLDDQKGPDPSYNYGKHFLYQGHETGTQGYITRINLDAVDAKHKITLLATTESTGAKLPVFDGSVFYPFSQHLLFSAENGAAGGIWQASLDFPSKVDNLTGIMGKGGYEGMQADDQGRIIIVEDVGGSSGAVNTHAKRPNSFVYRFVPYDTANLLAGGVLQVLQVTSLDGTPMSFGKYASADAAILSQDVKDLHTYGRKFQAKFINIHDTKVDGTAPFDANALAKAKLGTPFKRPENGQFRPGWHFSQFLFDETGDTNLLTEAGKAYGGFGSIFKLEVDGGDDAEISMVYAGDSVHAGFDNVAFWDDARVVFVEDAGDTLHTQRNALDSAYLFDLDVDYSTGAQPVRILAQGRDPSATIDSLLLSGLFSGSFVNEGDNEITGWHLSDGDSTVRGLIGTKVPKPFRSGWRLFYNQQHGNNNAWEILSAQRANVDLDR
jgi:hypothetical protein